MPKHRPIRGKSDYPGLWNLVVLGLAIFVIVVASGLLLLLVWQDWNAG